MIGDHLAWKGLRNRLDDHGIPLVFAMQMAGACYPLGASREARLGGFVFARSLISSYEAREIVEKLLAVPESQQERLLNPSLVEIFGREQVEAWVNEVAPDQEPINEAPLEREYQQILRTSVEDAKPEPPWDEEQEEAKQTVGRSVVPPPTTTEPPDGPISFPDPPVAPRTTWYLLATAGVLSVSAIGVALSLPRTEIPVQPGPQAPIPTPHSPGELKLKKAITSARELLSKKRYQSAVEAVSSFLPKPPRQPDDIKDKQLWADYLKVFADSRTKQYGARQGTRTEQEMYEHWPAMHDIGLAWHYLMKDALADENVDLAKEAFRQADKHYMDLLIAIRPSGKLKNAQEWRLILCGLAMENRSIVRSQLASATGDERLKSEARDLLENARLFYGQTLGTDSQEYRRVYEDLAKLGRAPGDR